MTKKKTQIHCEKRTIRSETDRRKARSAETQHPDQPCSAALSRRPAPGTRPWPAGAQPGEKLLRAGPSALSDCELLAVVLRRSCRGGALSRSAALVERFGGLRALTRLSPGEWGKLEGFGFAGYTDLLAAAELGRRCLAEHIVRDGPLESPGAAGDYLRALLRDRGREVFGCLVLDTRHRVVGFEELFHGTIDGIAVHNHPSGIAEPSQSDIALTHRLRDALDLVDVRLLDHLVIGDGETVSLSRRGHL